MRPSGAQNRARQILGHESAALFFILIGLIFGIGGISEGASLSRLNATNVLLQSSIKGVTAVGQAFVILTAGIDVSVGGMALFASTVGAALISTTWENIIGHPVSMGLGLLVMVGVSVGWGAVNGALVSRVGIPALIATLGLWQITTGAAFEVILGKTVGGLPEAISWFGQGMVAGVPVPVIVFIVVAVIAYLVLNYTSYGRAIYAVGGSPVSAWLSGINVKKVLFTVFLISGFLAGLTAILQLGRVESASMNSLSGLEIDSIAAVAIGGVSLMGGRGNLIGVVLGTLIVGVISNGLSILRASPPLIRIAKGAIVIAAVVIDYVRRKRTAEVV
jgi:ribose/xylose/arabinose/galactoside ABC-type transport system permease subunit